MVNGTERYVVKCRPIGHGAQNELQIGGAFRSFKSAKSAAITQARRNTPPAQDFFIYVMRLELPPGVSMPIASDWKQVSVMPFSRTQLLTSKRR